MAIKILILFLSLSFIIATVTSSPPQPSTKIRQGVLNGVYMKTVNDRKYSAFLGIPFAKPPSGEHRFREPFAPEPWLGVYNATSYSEDCLQYSHIDYKVHGSEDCLYLNVYTPKFTECEIDEPLDVIVFIHGGTYMFFSGSIYRADYLLDRNVVLVTITYRVGPLGFLSTEDDVLPGNNGLKDQVAALHWVKKNIAAFGGNPNSITIAGLSAGGSSVEYHVLSPQSQGLFNKAISFGGTALCSWTQEGHGHGHEKAMKLAHHLGCPSNNSLLAIKCLRERPANQIVAASKIFQPWLFYPVTPFGIVIEKPGPTAFITEKPIDIIKQKKSKDLPFLFTMNADEGLYPGAEILANPKNIETIEAHWDNYLPHLLDYYESAPAGHLDAISQKIKEFYLKTSTVNDAKHEFIKMIGDRLFYSGIIKSARLHAQRCKSPVYAYLFSYKGSKSLGDVFGLSPEVYNGTSHGDDVGYIMKPSYNKLIENHSDDSVVSNRLMDYILTFIKGAPMPKGWPPVRQNLPKFAFLDIKDVHEAHDVVRVEDDYGNEEFWNSLELNENQSDLAKEH